MPERLPGQLQSFGLQRRRGQKQVVFVGAVCKVNSRERESEVCLCSKPCLWAGVFRQRAESWKLITPQPPCPENCVERRTHLHGHLTHEPMARLFRGRTLILYQLNSQPGSVGRGTGGGGVPGAVHSIRNRSHLEKQVTGPE